MKQNYYVLFPFIAYFAFKSIAAMNERKVFSQCITGVLYIFIYTFNTATISGWLQSSRQFLYAWSSGNATAAFQSSSSAIASFFYIDNEYGLVRAGACPQYEISQITALINAGFKQKLQIIQ